MINGIRPAAKGPAESALPPWKTCPGGPTVSRRRAVPLSRRQLAPAGGQTGGMPGMSALAFVQSLLDTGRVRVPPDRELPADLDAAVAELDRAVRPELAFDPP